jgi:hypothetical protein
VRLLAATDVERWIVLLPALVVGTGLVAGVLILLGLAAAIVILTYLGIELPREG